MGKWGHESRTCHGSHCRSGPGFADALADRGHDLILVARNEERLASVAADLRRTHGVAVETVSADLGRRDDVDRVAALLADPNGRCRYW